MPAQIKKLIDKLKRERPELADEPLLDDILDASYGEEPNAEADEMADAEMPAEHGEPESDMAMMPEEGMDDESMPGYGMDEGDEESADEQPAANVNAQPNKPKRKKVKAPSFMA